VIPSPTMTREIDVAAAKMIAEKFLSRERTFERLSGGPSRPQVVGECSAVFWWDDATALYEFPFNDASGSPSGYVVIPSTRRLAPVLEYCFSGSPLSAQLNHYLSASLTTLGEAPRNVQWYFVSPLEIIARVSLEGIADAAFLEIPTLRNVPPPTDDRIVRDASRLWTSNDLSRAWSDLEGWPGLRTPNVRGALWYRPVRYQQGCDAYGRSCKLDLSDGGTTYCSPHCIAGCTCVAWAMLASSWKKHGQGGANTRIWAGSACWNIDWPSSTNPSRCQNVHESIWAWHSLMGTGCSGGTSFGNIESGGGYFGSKWGLPWQWGSRDDVGIGDAQELVDKGQPFLFSAVGQWQSRRKTSGRKSSSPKPGASGHSVVAYGYDAANQTILISLGWGSSFADKWIAIGAYESRQAVFVRSWGVTVKGVGKRDCAVADIEPVTAALEASPTATPSTKRQRKASSTSAR